MKFPILRLGRTVAVSVLSVHLSSRLDLAGLRSLGSIR